MASGLLYSHRCLLPGMLVLLPTFTLGSKYLLPAKKFNSNTVCMCELVPLNVNSGAQPTASLRSIRGIIRTVTDIEMIAVRKCLRCSATHSGQKPLPVLFLFPIAY